MISEIIKRQHKNIVDIMTYDDTAKSIEKYFEADGDRFKLYIELEKEPSSKLLFGCEQSLCCCIFSF